MTTLTTDLDKWLSTRRELKAQGKSIGFVPTMGALHDGHAALLERSRKENDFTLLSIYVNPTQFDNPEDLRKYPVTLDRDRELAERLGVDEILAPTYAQLYPDGYRFRVSETEFSNTLCGAHRPGHFNGVLTVVLKLLQLAQCQRAYFGEKDFQQLSLIQDMSQAFFLDTEIIAVPTVRESDGLAMSSRNVRLEPAARNLAPKFYEIIAKETSADRARLELEVLGFAVDYIEDLNLPTGLRRFGAVKLDGVRLIDNVAR